jgi:hypothetical protein
MPQRVDLDRARRAASRLNSLGGKPVSGRPAIRAGAWTIERLVEEVEALRAECVAQAARRRPREYCHTSFRLFRPIPRNTPETTESGVNKTGQSG